MRAWRTLKRLTLGGFLFAGLMGGGCGIDSLVGGLVSQYVNEYANQYAGQMTSSQSVDNAAAKPKKALPRNVAPAHAPRSVRFGSLNIRL